MAGAGCRRGVLRAVGGSLAGGEDDPDFWPLGTPAMPLALLHNSSETPTWGPELCALGGNPQWYPETGLRSP